MLLDRGLLVRIGRELRGMSQKELAETSFVPQSTISKIESSIMEPTAEALAAFSNALRLPIEFFNREMSFTALPPLYYRTTRLSAKNVRRMQAFVTVATEHIRRLLSNVEVSHTKPPRIDLESEERDMDGITADLRAKYNIPPGPIRDLTSLAERMGIAVIPVRFPTTETDGVTVYHQDMPPLVFLNVEAPGDRWRLSLAHEMGHVILHAHQIELMETKQHHEEAFGFAASLLMPRREFRQSFRGHLSLHHLAEMKRYWGCSMQAIVMRASDLGEMSPHLKSKWFAYFSRSGYRRKEPIEIPRETAEFLKDLVQVHRKSLGYRDKDFQTLLTISADELPAIYPEHFSRSNIRIMERGS